MAQTNINIRMDDKLKHDFDHICGELGLTMTSAFTVFAKTVVRRKGIPFIISKDAAGAIEDFSCPETDKGDFRLSSEAYDRR